MLTNESLVKRITQVIALCWLLMKIISLKLWITQRDYPLVPITNLPSSLHIVLLVLFFILVVWLIFKPGNKYAMMVLIATEAISLLGDQTRLQPWHYQFIFIFFAIAFNKDCQKSLQAIVLITVSTYLFSGIQKMHPGFINSVWSVHILKVFLGLPGYLIQHPVVQWAGYMIPIIEVAGALGLLFPKMMKGATYLLISMHVFLLVFLGPLGINHNVVVWPWNIQLIVLLWLLFIKNKVLLRPAACKSAANLVIAFFWIIMPVAGCFGYWDKYLSSGIYSGKTRVKQFYFGDRDRIPPGLRKYARHSTENASARILLTDWCVKELNVAPVTEPRVLNSIVNQLNEKYAARGFVFVLTEAPY